MNIIKINLQTLLTDNNKFQELTLANPWGFIIESSRTKIKVMPNQQWNQFCYKGKWSFSILEK